MSLKITILGSSSATPTKTRNPSAQLLQFNQKYFLIDCGEGTQMQMLKYGIKHNRLHHIFISHLHGDHFLGLYGLLFTFHLFNRQKAVHIYAPPELEKMIKMHIDVAGTTLSYPLHFHPLNIYQQGVILEDDTVKVSYFSLKHRIPTFGFLFQEKPKERRIIKNAIEKYNLSIEDIRKAKKGETVTGHDGKITPLHLISNEAAPSYSYAYCSDTAYHKKMIPKIKGTDILYHEATYADDLKESAEEKYHATARQAALIAKEAGVQKLIIGHFSTRYKSLDIFLKEAKEEFPNTFLAEEGKTYEI